MTNWLETESDDDARSRAAEFWTGLQADLDAGAFWADRIKTYQGDPAKRLKLALKNLPLPGAFREGAVATRALIREKRREGEPFEEELQLLYWLAAIRSFLLDYAPRLEEPGFNVIEAVPGKRLRSLRYTYRDLGYRQLDLLNKTDVKWLIELWGEPAAHSTLNTLHRSLWDEYEDKLIEQRGRSEHQLDARLRGRQSATKKAQERNGCGIVALFTVIAITWLFWIGG